MKDELYIDKDQLMALTGIGKKKAYQIIRQVNAELEAAGYLVIKGRCPRKQLFKRLGIVEGTEEEGAGYVLPGVC
ncbi:LysR family transcriptional regulator [Anaerovibrio sp.]|uniref:LysR family transcriptional regulator n=1 Tax=Anaerovibrio sp. TaxID=1872532 RepID=UPI0025C1D511|nr:LysR family transcriptional regulator [Anaerovibrio sp.]MBR2142059.1 LysR family transcriptional regulator [Anaerovibrio sp.]